jgi:hypothetical protein
MRKFFSDTFSMLTFSTIVGMLIEIFISKMTFGQSIQARLTAMPANFITTRPYGFFRDYLFHIFKVEDKTNRKGTLVDILAFVLFQVPLYASILLFSGANMIQILKACSTLTIFSIFLGRPYGLFLDFSRWLFRVKTI